MAGETIISLPRMRGDDPGGEAFCGFFRLFAPHARG